MKTVNPAVRSKCAVTTRSKRATSFKLSDTALDILADLSIKRGVAKSAIVENLLRAEHKRDVYRAQVERDYQSELERERK